MLGRHMFTIGGIKVPPIESLSDTRVEELVREILHFARSNPQSAEHDVLDFKRELNITHKYKIRKLFSSFANTRGGLLIIGIDEKKDYEVSGITKIPENERLSQILSTDDYIKPLVRYFPRLQTYQGKKIVLYYIYESCLLPVEIRKGKDKQWETWGRTPGGTIRPLSRIDVMLKFYRGIRKIPVHARVKICQLGYYQSDDTIKKPFLKWSIKNQGDIYKWLQIPWMSLIPLPSPFIPFRHSSDLYFADISWFGKHENLPEIVTELENTIQDTYGIGFEVWTVPLSRSYTVIEDPYYFSGCGADSLNECLMGLYKNKRNINFGWLVFGKSITCIVTGGVHGDSCNLDINSIISFVPNNFPFPSIDDAGRIILEPLPVNKTMIANKLKEWKFRVKDEFWLEDLSDEQLAIFPSGRIIGYLGGKPRPQSYDSPFRADGLTVIKTELGGNLRKSIPPLITNMAPLLCYISSAPSGLNDLKEIKIIGIKCIALPISLYPLKNLTLVLFSIDCYVNQFKSLKLHKN